jgi:hypothetical protein
MRPQAQLRGGFYPAPEEAVATAILYLTPPKSATAILDPCCGEGRAIRQLSEHLGGKVFGIELEEGRAKSAREWLLPAGGQVLGPADFMGCTITPAGSLGFVWCNPPFSDEIGGGSRVEYPFLVRATQLLMPKGVMAFVCPEDVAKNRDIVNHIFSWYTDLGMIRFPEGHRKYKEVVCFGVRRERAVEASLGKSTQQVSWDLKPGCYRVPPAAGPRVFLKTRHTQGELLKALAASPLQRLFKAPPPQAMARPPLELSKGQMALVLAGGYLNGVVQKPGEPPIVIKATPYKEDYMKESTTEVRGEGTDKEREVQVTVMSQRIKLRVRVAEQSGKIHDVQ